MTDYNKGYEKLEAAEKEIAQLKAQLSLLQWTAIEEGLPPLNTFVLMAGGKRYGKALMAGYHNEHDEWLIESCSDTINVYPPKFWMLINPPAPPTQQEEK